MGSCVAKDSKAIGGGNRPGTSSKGVVSSGLNQDKNILLNGIRKKQGQKSLEFNHAALRSSDFLFNKFRSSDGKPQQVSLGFMLNKCVVDLKNRQVMINYVNSSPIKIWIVYGGVQKVSETGLTVEITNYKSIEQVRLTSGTQNKNEGDPLPPIQLPEEPKDCIMIVLEPELSSSETLFMIYRYQIMPQEKEYTLISQVLQWCSLSFRISDIYGSEYLFRCDDQNEACSVCLTNKSECILLPCRHMCVCGGCLEYIEKTKPNCPLCRKQYYSVVKYASEKQ